MAIWKSCPAQISLPDKSVHIWRVNLDVPARFQTSLFGLLSPQECERASKFQFERDRRRFVISHGVLRTILSRYLAREPEQVQYQINKDGKPRLLDIPGLYFNLSHSNEIALISVTLLDEVGVDVEYIRPLEDMDQLARQCFSPQEYRQFKTLPTPENSQAFFSCWTRKEAFLKALGSGLAYPLQNFSVSLLPGESARLVLVSGKPAEPQKWSLRNIEVDSNYAAAFALRSTCQIVDHMDWV